MGVSKVVLGEETLVDLTSDSVNEENLLRGATAHNASGEKIEGNVLVPTKISQLENDSEFLNNSSTVNFEQASERINIQSSDSIKTILGKIKKWFSDLKTVAFSGSYSDLSNKPIIPTIPTPVNNLLTTVEGQPLDAVQGKVLNDKISDVTDSLVKYKVLKASVNGFAHDPQYNVYYKSGIVNQIFSDAEFPSNIVALIPLNGNYSGYVCNFTIDKNTKDAIAYINSRLDGTHELRLGVLYR